MFCFKMSLPIKPTRSRVPKRDFLDSCLACNVEEVIWHLNNGADVNQRDDDQRTPLHMCLILPRESSVFRVVRLLIQNSADPCAKDINGKTPLHMACTTRKTLHKTVHHLLKADTSGINEVDILGNTALHYASRHMLPGAVEILLEYGADPDLKNLEDKTPLQYAIPFCRHSIELILKKTYID